MHSWLFRKFLLITSPIIIFFTLSILIIVGSFYTFDTISLSKAKKFVKSPLVYSLFASKPKVLGAFAQSIILKEASPEVIRQFMAKYHANKELISHADDFVKYSKEYKINIWLPVAIGMCEGNLGRSTPKYNGEETYNTWGWAASERDLAERTGRYHLGSWEEAIETVIKGLATSNLYKKYTTKNTLTKNDIENIMKWYAPASVKKGGPWADCVWYFYQELENFVSTP